jgi:hypothetical protein
LSGEDYASEVGEDFPFQERTWRVERIGWLVVLALLVAAVAGLFSGGLLGRATASDPEGRLVVEYDRFARYGAPAEIVIRATGGDGGPERTIRLSPALVEAFGIEAIHPRPEREFAAADGLRLVVRLEEGGALRLAGKAMGRLAASGEIALEGHAPARLTMFIWP